MTDDTIGTNNFSPPAPEPIAEPADVTAQEKLRAFEDRHLGEDAVRINGEVEKGHGSRFKALSQSHHHEYAALERLCEAEKKVGEAASRLAQAQSAYDEAKAHAENAAVAAPAEQPTQEG